MFALNGLMVTIFFFLCYHVRYVSMTTVYCINCCGYTYSDSILGAIFGTLQFFYNHSEVSYFLYIIFYATFLSRLQECSGHLL